MNSLENLQKLYDRHRFLEAFSESAPYWRPSTPVEDLSPQELILGGRLAGRLGGRRLSRWLLRIALERYPSNPRVRYFCRHLRRQGQLLLDDLWSFEAHPDLCHDDPELQAEWFASHAVTWAFLRDFARANECIERARSFDAENRWVLSCESNALALADRWEEALKPAEVAWEIDPGAPFVAHSLGNSLLNLGRIQESARRLFAAAQDSQSYEVVHLACWHQCALAETLQGGERAQILGQARELAESLMTLAPLADRESRSSFARTWLDISQLADDHEQMERWSKEVRSPFHRRILDNLRNHPKGRRLRLPFQRALQKHETCLPTSVASALAAMGVQIDPDRMAADLTFGGTSEWAAAEWLEKKGLTVRFFTVTSELASTLIQNDIAFVLTLEADETAHAVAVVGLDEAAGTLLIHDPSTFRTGECLLESLERMKSPLGPKGMVAVPRERAALVDRFLPHNDAELMAALRSHQEAVVKRGGTAAGEIVLELTKRQPSHPGTRLLQAIQASEDARIGDAVADLKELLKAFPNAAFVRARLLAGCHSLANTSLMREILASVVERGILPGVESQQDWVYPPAPYVCRYAELLRMSAATRGQARSLLYSVIRRQPTCAEAWHVLGDLQWHEREFEHALLSRRIASCLASSNERYALIYCDSLAYQRREGVGLAWLEGRVRKFGSSPRAVGTWMSWITALENWGHPERALEVAMEALAQYDTSPELRAFAVPFLARMGQWDQAEALLNLLASGDNSSLHHEAAVEFYRMRGELDRSVHHAEAWVQEVPRHVVARHALLDLIAKRDGARFALERAARWLAANPQNEDLEGLYYERLERAGSPGWKKYSLLLRRVKRNPDDGWAWRELTFCCLYDYESTNERCRQRLKPRVLEFLSECDRTAPEDPATIRAHAQWHEACGQWTEALAGWLESLDRDPTNFYSYHHVWNCSTALEAQQRRSIWEQIEPLLLNCPGRLSIARDLLKLVAQRFGVAAAEQSASKWQETRPDNPEVIEAVADLLLENGHGRSDAARALAMLQPAVERFPYQVGLRFSLADAYRRLEKFAEAQQVLQETIRRHPGDSNACIQLAWVHELQGDRDEARRVLEAATARDPQNPSLADALARILIRSNRFTEARAATRRALQLLPEDINWRERAIWHLLECGDVEGAVEAARKGVGLFPGAAYLWFLLGATLNQARRFAAQGEIERCFRRSIALNESLFGSADLLSMLLVEQRRYREAAEVIHRIQPRLFDPSVANGRLAWIHRMEGRKSEGVEEMASVVRTAPWNRWGWSVLMDWLVEDQAWDKARSLLDAIPEELRTDTQFRSERLIVLERAGLPANELDVEWNDLLRDFPDDVSLHLRRYDSLREAKRLSESAVLLNAVRVADPDNPHVLARFVEVLCEQGKQDEAIAALVRIFFAEVEKSTWPADKSWEAIRKAHFQEHAFRKILGLVQHGSRPTPHAVSILVSYLIQRNKTTEQLPQPVGEVRTTDQGTRELLSLLGIVDRNQWSDGRYRLPFLRQLSELGCYRLVIKYWKQHRTQVEDDVGSWAETGRALIALGRKKEARNLLASWRERSGVGMWVVANYVDCFSGLRAKDLREVVSACHDALAGLPHDNCARYLVHVQAEAYALLGDTTAFRKTWDQYQSYFDCKPLENDWFRNERTHLLADIPMMARFLEQNRTRLYRKMRWSLRWQHIFPPLVPGTPQGSSLRIDNLPWWVWWLLIWLAIQVVRNS